MKDIKDIEIIVEKLIDSERVAVLTGAGVSAESGIKTFRDPDGLWAKFNPAELASAQGFLSNPELVWEWYNHRRSVLEEAKPNPGHYALAELEKLTNNFTLTTQNVDGLHQQAGSENVYELHGSIVKNHCFECCEPYLSEIDIRDKEIPKCESCGGRIRPSVVWFGEMLPEEAIKKSEIAALNSEIYIVAGTSGEVYPAAGLPSIASNSGALVVDINPNLTAIGKYADVHLAYPSAEILPVIVSEYKKAVGI